MPPPPGGPQEPHWEWGPKPGQRAEEGLAFPKPPFPGRQQTEPGSSKVVQASFLGEPGHHGGEAVEPGTSGLTRQHASDILGAPTLLAGPREATRQSSGTEPKVAEGGSHGSEPPECQLWGGLPQEGLPLKWAQSKERQGGEEVDEDRDIDESSPQDSPPSQVSPTQGGPAPQAVSGEAPGTPGSPAGGVIPLPVDFLSKASAETRVPEPDGPSEGPLGEGHGGSPEFTFHVEITANLQKEQGPPLEVDLEGTALPGAPGEEQEPRSPSEGEDTKKTDLPEPSGKQPAAGLPGKPVSRVPQLKGLCLELLRSRLATSCATQASGTATQLPAPPWLLPLLRPPGTATNQPPGPLLTFPATSCPSGAGSSCSSHACPPSRMSPRPPPTAFCPVHSSGPLISLQGSSAQWRLVGCTPQRA